MMLDAACTTTTFRFLDEAERQRLQEQKKKAAGKKPPFDAYGPVVVGVLYDRLGNVITERKLSELLPKSSHRKLRLYDRRFVWMEGVLGVPGKEPRVNDRNQVEFETVEPRTQRLDFQE